MPSMADPDEERFDRAVDTWNRVAIAGAVLGIPAALLLGLVDPPLWLSMAYLLVMALVLGAIIVRGHRRV